MHQVLAQHPTILGPVWRRSIHYFDLEGEQDLEWYRARFPLQWQVDRAERRHGTRALTFESSSYYLYHPRAADRIADELPDVQVLILVRDPIERAFAAHARERARGVEDLDFATALEREDDRLRGEAVRLLRDPRYRSHAHQYQAYCGQGEYAPQIEQFASLLGRDRVKVVDSHRLLADPEPVLADVLAWLGVAPRRTQLFERRSSAPYPDLDPGLRDELDQRFLPFDIALTPWLGHVPTWRQ